VEHAWPSRHGVSAPGPTEQPLSTPAQSLREQSRVGYRARQHLSPGHFPVSKGSVFRRVPAFQWLLLEVSAKSGAEEAAPGGDQHARMGAV